jgi:hypothetical protein
MKKFELRQLIREEIRKVINENQGLSSSDLEQILKVHGVTDMESLKDEITYSDLVDTVAEKMEGSAMGKASKDSYSKAHRMLLQYGKEKFGSMEESNLNEKYPSGVWDWDIIEFGNYNPSTRTFKVFMDGDAFADYMDTEFPGWLKDEDIAEEGREKFLKDIKNAVKEEYGPGIKIEGEGFSY